ncbi:copper resistance protein B [Neptunicella sp.]|uniref:copper resistance protein B n=1 Tax=Neptunicella sp. TaxID=2125986 RepID=UPI003F6920F9
MRNKLILNKKTAVAALVCLFSTATVAQQQNSDNPQPPMTKNADELPLDPNAIDHSAMGHGSMTDMDSMQGMDHSKMQHQDTDSMDPYAIDHSAMGHGSMADMDSMQDMDMSSQSNTPPPNARDPHAYSDGLTLDSGAFALPGPRQLKMADEHAFWTVLFDRFEYADGLSSGLGDATQYDMQTWYGSSYDRLVVKSEGEIIDSKLEESENQILWGHAITTFWDTQLGVKFDTSEGPSRQWLTFGLQGIAPYWFEIDASVSVGAEGRSAFDFEAEYELLITQRLVLQPRVVLSAYGKDDAQNGVGKGLSSLTAGVRLRYEFNRQFAPYLGVEWTGQYGNTADFTKLEGRSTRQTQWVAGVRFWFQ